MMIDGKNNIIKKNEDIDLSRDIQPTQHSFIKELIACLSCQGKEKENEAWTFN